MSEDYNITSGGITQEQFLNMIKNKDETFRNEALDIFTEYSKVVLKKYPESDFPVPDGITFASIDTQTGNRATANSTNSVVLPFYVGTVPEYFDSKDNEVNTIERGEDLLKQFF